MRVYMWWIFCLSFQCLGASLLEDEVEDILMGNTDSDDIKNYGGLLFTLQTRKLPEDEQSDWNSYEDENMNNGIQTKKETTTNDDKILMQPFEVFPRLSTDQKVTLEEFLKQLKQDANDFGYQNEDTFSDKEHERHEGKLFEGNDGMINNKKEIPMKHHIAWIKNSNLKHDEQGMQASKQKDLPKVLNPMNWKQMILDLLKLRTVDNDSLASSNTEEERRNVPGLSWKRVDEYQVPGLTWKKSEIMDDKKYKEQSSGDKLIDDANGLFTYQKKDDESRVPALPWRRRAIDLYNTKGIQEYKNDEMLGDGLNNGRRDEK